MSINYDMAFICFFPLIVSTRIPPSSQTIPSHDVKSSRSLTMTILSKAAVSGSASERVTADEEGMHFSPVENKM